MTAEMMEIEYNRARNLLEKTDISSLEEAVKVFEDLNDFKESDDFTKYIKGVFALIVVIVVEDRVFSVFMKTLCFLRALVIRSDLNSLFF